MPGNEIALTRILAILFKRPLSENDCEAIIQALRDASKEQIHDGIQWYYCVRVVDDWLAENHKGYQKGTIKRFWQIP
jgi:hypothetical protein